MQWTTASGGNGHWYALSGHSQYWEIKRAEAEATGAYLATLTSQPELDFALGMLGSGESVAWFGLTKLSGVWAWITEEPLVFTSWAISQPGDGGPTELFGALIKNTPWWGTGFADSTSPFCCAPYPLAIFEWSADCNSDGIVDYGQILSGELIDTNSNGIPDICEIDPCPGDINLNSVVDAVDLAMVLTSWGTSGGDYPRADVNQDGVVNGPDLGALLGGWGICP